MDNEKLINIINFTFPLCKKYKVKFIVNDRPEIVKKLNLDGVHVGKNDPSIEKCKLLLGKNKIIGKSCYSSSQLAYKSQVSGASYVAFGSFFNTKTKENTTKVFFRNIMAFNKIKKVPTVGIGGINYRNCLNICRLSLDYIAISSTIWQSNIRPDLSLKKIKNLIDNF